MNWSIFGAVIYVIILILVSLRIIFETQNTNKTLAYLLFAFFIPVIGIIFYITFGINYWRIKKYDRKSAADQKILQELKKSISAYNEAIIEPGKGSGDENGELAAMLIKDLGSPLTMHNTVELLINGENKFPNLMKAIEEATHHIHIEYYIYEYDNTGTALVELLIKKSLQGVQVRFIYDDFGSPSIKKKTEESMRKAGIEIHPFHKVRFYLLANRINYRNHRKIVVIDGRTAFVGGINVSDKYVNGGQQNQKEPGKLYWRDTHLRIDGPAVYYLQYLFMSDWNFCCAKPVVPDPSFFAPIKQSQNGSYVQVAASGPDSKLPSVLYSILQAIYLAKKEILITTPYFIPGDSIVDALCVAALSNLDVKLLVPGVCDSKFVNAASKSNYNKLLQAGVEIYMYQKGFVHAKTLTTDGQLSVVGTANMDYRSFELNFEVNAIIYDAAFAENMRKVFFEDLKYAEQIDKDIWLDRPGYVQLPEKIARLFSPVM